MGCSVQKKPVFTVLRGAKFSKEWYTKGAIVYLDGVPVTDYAGWEFLLYLDDGENEKRFVVGTENINKHEDYTLSYIFEVPTEELNIGKYNLSIMFRSGSFQHVLKNVATLQVEEW